VLEHPVIVPSELGPVGAIVHEPGPGIPRRGAVVLLQGGGPPCRAGINAFWTRVARGLAASGSVVFRYDFVSEGDSTAVGHDVPREMGWRRCVDLAILRQAAPWFLARANERYVSVVGDCHGSRVGLEFAAADTSVRGVFLISPYLSHREPHLRGVSDVDVPRTLDGRAWAGGPTLDDDDELIGGLRSCLERGPVCFLVGEDDEEAVRRSTQELDGIPRLLEIDVVHGPPLHPLVDPGQQDVARSWLLDRIAGAFAEWTGSATGP